jgi:diguanylate cyclase (GGDEF)-like protein
MSAEIEHYETLLAAAPLGCLLVEDGVIVRANPEAVETMGIPIDRLVGVPLTELLVPDHEHACRDLLDQSVAMPSTRSRSRAVRLASGLTPVELLARGLTDDLVVVGVRSMTTEHQYSAQAGGALTHDLVTGFPDHYHVLSQLQDRLGMPNRKPLALLCLWIDDLPSIAATSGKRTANRIMRETGLRLQDRLRGPDLLGRFDEAGFLVVMSSDSGPDQLTEIAERLRNEVAFPVELDKGLVSFTASVVVGSVTTHRVSIERILALLEAAANRAANSKGNRTDFLSI